MNWSTVCEKLADVQPRRRQRLSHYLKVIRSLVEAGFKLATLEMAAVYTQMVGDYDKELGCCPYYEYRKSTYPSIKKTGPNKYGLYAYGTHNRSEDIFVAVECLAELHAADIDAGRAWLLPVLDDDEYISWEFDVVVGSVEEVLATLRQAVVLMRADPPSQAGYGRAP